MNPTLQSFQKKLPGYAMVLSATLLLTAASGLWAQPVDPVFEPYSARYAVYRNGKLQARSEFLFQKQGENWIIKNESVGTHGMARFLKFRDYEFVEGRIDGDRFQPLRYVHDLKWIGPNQSSSADFDWENGTVEVVHKGESATLELVEGAVDPMSLQLALRKRLANPEQSLEFMLVEDDEIELQRFQTLPDEQMETSLGCLKTIPVEKIRRSSTRFTRFWHASDLHFIPVRMEHGKTDGDHMELRITELSINGELVEPTPGCAARHGGKDMAGKEPESKPDRMEP